MKHAPNHLNFESFNNEKVGSEEIDSMDEMLSQS